MKVLKVIESKRYRNIKTNDTCSIYGAVPWTNEIDKNNWIIETVGFTWQCSNGTIGLGRKPVKTYKEAIEIMDKVNSL